jgi:hypothetical protein
MRATKATPLFVTTSRLHASNARIRFRLQLVAAEVREVAAPVEARVAAEREVAHQAVALELAELAASLPRNNKVDP